MSLATFLLFAQLAAPLAPARPVLSFPERGLDDTAAYAGYQTRLFRDAAGNTLQIYLDSRAQRVVHLWADAEDESIGFTARAPMGGPPRCSWASDAARVGRAGRARIVEYSLVADDPRIVVGWFLLGSMRVERDLQYGGRQKSPFSRAPFVVAETDRLLAALARLEPAERARQLGAAPRHQPGRAPRATRADGRARAAAGLPWCASSSRRSMRSTRCRSSCAPIRARRHRGGGRFGDAPRASRQPHPLHRPHHDDGRDADADPARGDLHPGLPRLPRGDASATPRAPAHRATSCWVRAALERQVRGLELLVSHEKLMAGLPTYATYFGRDMLMSALMLRPVWKPAMSEFAIASALRKLSPEGRVSHEEALGGQAVREASSEYATLVDSAMAAPAGATRDALLDARARACCATSGACARTIT